MENKKGNPFVLIVLAPVVLVVFLLGCGVKGPPVPPRAEPLAPITDLSYRIEKGWVIMNWSLPGEEQTKGPMVTGYIVKRAQSSLSSPDCPNCPLAFERVARMTIQQARSQEYGGRRAVYSEALKAGFKYTYNIKAFSDSGQISDDSNLVEFEY